MVQSPPCLEQSCHPESLLTLLHGILWPCFLDWAPVSCLSSSSSVSLFVLVEHILLEKRRSGGDFVHSSCGNKAPQTGWLIKKHLFPTVLEAGKYNLKGPADLVSGKGPLAGANMAVFSLCPRRTEGTRDLSAACSVRALITFTMALLS